MKKVTFTSYDNIRNPYYGGGGARSIHEVAKRLSNNYEVSILTSPLGTCTTPKSIDGVNYVPISRDWHQPQFAQFAYSFTLPRSLRYHQFDFLIENFTPPVSSSWLPLYTEKTVVGLVHLLSGKPMAQKYRMPVFALIERMALKHYKYLIALTQISRHKLRSLSPRAQIRVIPNGINLPDSHNEVTKRKYWLYLGRIDYAQKDFGLLLKAFDLAAKTCDWKLIIAGTGEGREVKRLREDIQASAYRDRISFMGQADGEAKEKLLNTAGLLVMPSRYETQPISLLEAFAYGCPAIVSDISDLDWIPQNSVWRTAREPQVLAQIMVRAANDPRESERKAKHARTMVRDQTWDKVAARYAQAIEEWI